MTELDLSPEQVFLHFKIVRVLGEGGMGRVYEAEHQFLRRRIALKVMLSERVDDEMKARMIQEARALAALEHPNVVGVYDAGVVAGNIWIAMEYLEGRTLRSARNVRGPYPVSEGLDVLIEICDGVAAAHEIHIVHRDLKPENVILTAQNRVKVLDFGAAKVLRRGDRVSTVADASGKKRIIGTPEYMSPEHLSGQSVDGRTDVYAICCMGYELLARHPFASPDGSMPELYEIARRQFVEPPPPLRSLAPHVPADVAAMLERGLSKSAAQRPSAAELAGSFRAARAAWRDHAQSMERAPFENRWTGPGSWAAHGPAVSLPQKVTPPSDPSRRVLVQTPDAAMPTVSSAAPVSPPVLAGDTPHSHAQPVYARTEEILVPAEPRRVPDERGPAPQAPPRPDPAAHAAMTVMPETTGRDPRALPPARARARRTAALLVLGVTSVAGLALAAWFVERAVADQPERGAVTVTPSTPAPDAGTVPELSDAGTAPELSDAGTAPELSDAGTAPGDQDAGTLDGPPDAGANAAASSTAKPSGAVAQAGATAKPTAGTKPAVPVKASPGATAKSGGGELPFGPRPLSPGK